MFNELSIFFIGMNVTLRNVVRDAMNSEFLSLIQSDISIPDAYKKLIGENSYGLMTCVSKVKYINPETGVIYLKLCIL